MIFSMRPSQTKIWRLQTGQILFLGQLKNAVEEMRENPGSKKAYKATSASKGIIDVVKNNTEMLKELFKIKSEEDVTLQDGR